MYIHQCHSGRFNDETKFTVATLVALCDFASFHFLQGHQTDPKNPTLIARSCVCTTAVLQ